MATLTAERQVYKASKATTDAYCLRIVLKDGTIYRYNSSLSDLTMNYFNNEGVRQIQPPVVYQSATGLDFSAVGLDLDSPGALDLEGSLESLGVTKEQVAQGLFSKARLYVFLTDYTNPTEDDEAIFSGFWGETTIIDGRYVIKFNSLIDTLQVDTSRIISNYCDTKLGSFRCGVDFSTPPVWQSATSYNGHSSLKDGRNTIRVKSSTDDLIWAIKEEPFVGATSGTLEPNWGAGAFGNTVVDGPIRWRVVQALVANLATNAGQGLDGLLELNSTLPTGYEDWFENGFLRFTSGPNIGQEIKIVSNTTTVLTLEVPLFKETLAGDTIIVTAGCNKRVEDCNNKFYNIYNYQGFPALPGRKLIQVEGSL